MIFHLLGHNMQFSIQHRALLLLFAAGCQCFSAGERFDGSILHNGNGMFSFTAKLSSSFFGNYCNSTKYELFIASKKSSSYSSEKKTTNDKR